MARLLAAGSFSQTIAEEVGYQKLATQYIQRELCEADDANLIDEEDMHVFGLKPMTDPLHLVCCNACKKPIKDSQYAAHAEFCKILNPSEEIVSELGGGMGNKRPPRKDRKKLPTPRATTTGGELERTESAEADDVSLSDFHVDEKIQRASFSIDAKRNSACVDGALIMDGSRVSPGNKEYSIGAAPPPRKRSKLIAAEGVTMTDHLGTNSAVAKSLCAGAQEARTNVPAPLATKMFYSQRNQRLRSALTYLYYGESSKEQYGDLVKLTSMEGNSMPLNSVQENAVPLQVLSPTNIPHEQINVQREKRERVSLPSDQILADSSDVNLGKLGGRTPVTSFSNHVPVSNVLRPTTPVGVMRSNYSSKPYTFAGNSGTSLGTMQQPKGSVPVT